MPAIVLALLIWVAISLIVVSVYIFVMVRYNTRPMRTADEKQIERETAAIQRNESAYDLADELLGLVQRWRRWLLAAGAAVTALIFIASKTI